MGFTPWLYEATLTAQDTTYNRLATHGDVIKHHLSAGIPWQEALDNTPYHPNVEAEISGRLDKTADTLDVFLAIDSLNTGRDNLTYNWGENTNMTRSGAWATRSWSSPEVINSYIAFAKDMINRFKPTHFEYGTEVSELIINDLNGYNDFIIFAEAVYTEIKSNYPDLKLIISVSLKTPGSLSANLITQHIPRIMDYTDMLGISVYPYVFFDHSDRSDPANIPDNWLSQINDYIGDKALIISETGWIAEDLTISDFSYAELSDETKQAAFMETLLNEANDLNAELVIWWTVSDFDKLWTDTLGESSIAKIWKDIGLYDEDQNPRVALNVWDTWLGRGLNFDYQNHAPIHNQ